MSQKQFDLHFKCTQIEARNGEREAENDALKQEVVSLKFEVKLLKEFMDFEMQENKDAIIESQEQLLAEKDAEIARLKLVFNQSMEDIDLSLLDAFNEADNADQNEKWGRMLVNLWNHQWRRKKATITDINECYLMEQSLKVHQKKESIQRDESR